MATPLATPIGLPMPIRSRGAMVSLMAKRWPEDGSSFFTLHSPYLRIKTAKRKTLGTIM